MKLHFAIEAPPGGVILSPYFGGSEIPIYPGEND